MRVIRSISEMQKWTTVEHSAGHSVGFVPTMGALHQGHAELFSRSVSENKRTVVSIFVNSLQFNSVSDLEAYPRQLEQDKVLAEQQSGKKHALVFDQVPILWLMGSQKELFSALSNLVSNAIRYTPLGGLIHVTFSQTENQLTISVKDTGPGIASEHLPRLTERFYRVDQSRSRETGGTGLGLAITKHVMQRHGGELQIQSELGKGSSFNLIFPASRVANHVATPDLQTNT